MVLRILNVDTVSR